jgi:hypothetical protein
MSFKRKPSKAILIFVWPPPPPSFLFLRGMIDERKLELNATFFSLLAFVSSCTVHSRRPTSGRHTLVITKPVIEQRFGLLWPRRPAPAL